MKEKQKAAWEKFYTTLKPEAQLQNKCVYYLKKNRPDLVAFSIPNEGERTASATSYLKLLGMLPGMPDICVIGKGAVVVFFEFKTTTTKLTTKQTKVHDQLRAVNAPVFVIRTFDDFLFNLDFVFHQ